MIPLLHLQRHFACRSLTSVIRSQHTSHVKSTAEIIRFDRVNVFTSLRWRGTNQAYRSLSMTPQTENAIPVQENLEKAQPMHFNTKKEPFNFDFNAELQSVSQGKLIYATNEESPILVISSASISQECTFLPKESGTAFPFRLDLPLSVMSYQIKEEYPQLQDVSFHESTADSRPSFKYSQHFTVEDVIQKAIHNPCRGFFISINGNRIFIQIPTFKERTFMLDKNLSIIEERLKPLRELKEKCDSYAVNTNKKLVTGGMAGLCAYFGIMAKLTWWDYGWDVIEPFTYFTGVSVGIFGYLYFLITKRDYTYEAISKYAISRRQMNLYLKHGFDLETYQTLCSQRDKTHGRIKKIKEEYEAHV
ncbi:hypothetical protein K7432_001041 [Basidiobolus ranarum]|uniref:Calcium uniporter protein, mitochondrial n=1 Tax=Basidiobolus ranarum TaxID=34480 RepID=A0ABR2X3R5_9FUNG